MTVLRKTAQGCAVSAARCPHLNLTTFAAIFARSVAHYHLAFDSTRCRLAFVAYHDAGFTAYFIVDGASQLFVQPV